MHREKFTSFGYVATTRSLCTYNNLLCGLASVKDKSAVSTSAVFRPISIVIKVSRAAVEYRIDEMKSVYPVSTI